MALVPDSLTVQTTQVWIAGNPPEPTGDYRVDAWAIDDQGNLVHKFFDVRNGGDHWSGWENLGHPG